LADLVGEYGNSLVAIRTVAAAGVPATLVSKALELKKQRRGRQDRLAQNDQIWVVFDCDDHVHVKTSIHNAEQNEIYVAYSNPCFELWAYLHLDDFDAPIHRDDLYKHLVRRMPSYDPSKAKRLDYALLRGLAEAAEKRAERMCARRKEERADRGNPYTDVFRLVRLIRDNGRIK
jgi:hypothetical protein